VCQVVAPSRWLADEAERQGLGPVGVLPHGVARSAPRAAPGPGAALVFVGTLAWHKGPDLVRDAWRRSKVPEPLRVYGPPGPDPRFQIDSDGALDGDGVMRILRGARALVLGSRWPENAPLVILEALSVGCPVIAPRIGGIPELVVDGVDGHLYRPGDVDDLARVLNLPLPTSVTSPPTFDAHLDALLALFRSPRRSNPVTPSRRP
jgi:glycosyltransferase involved in cell wall biosynthesis